MDCNELNNIIDNGEDSLNQFKENFDNIDKLREQLFRLMQSSKILFADELETNAKIEAIDLEYLERFYRKVYQEKLENHGFPLQKLLENLKLMSGQNLTLAGLLLFGSHPENIKPQFTIKATYFEGDDISVEWFRDSENILGKLLEQFLTGKNFVKRNLRRIQAGRNFNAPPMLEIPEAAFSEAIANAIIHRDYFINAPIFIYMFDSRVEIISPGALPNTVTEENIKYGIHIERNPTILTFLEKEQDFHYSGRGSGVPRMIAACKKQGIGIKLINDQDKQQFKVVFFRP